MSVIEADTRILTEFIEVPFIQEGSSVINLNDLEIIGKVQRLRDGSIREFFKDNKGFYYVEEETDTDGNVRIDDEGMSTLIKHYEIEHS